MEQEKEDVFAELLFEKYEELLKKLHTARCEQALAEAQMQNMQEDIHLLEWRIEHQAAHEKRIESDKNGEKSDRGSSTYVPSSD